MPDWRDVTRAGRPRPAEHHRAGFDDSTSSLGPIRTERTARLEIERLGTRQRSADAFGEGTGAAAIRDVVAFFDGLTDDEGTLTFAAPLAQEHGAHLTGVLFQQEFAFSETEAFVRGDGIPELLAEHHARALQMQAERRELFDSVVRRHGLLAEWRSVGPSCTASELGVHARYGDLAVISRAVPVVRQVDRAGIAEDVVLVSSRPVVVLPPRCTVSRVRRILVGWSAEREATRAVADALPLLVRAEAVEVLVVDCDGRETGHGSEPGADIARHLARHDVRVDIRQLSSGAESVGRRLFVRATDFGADLVVIGAHGRSRLGRWSFDPMTRTALHEASVPVLLSR